MAKTADESKADRIRSLEEIMESGHISHQEEIYHRDMIKEMMAKRD